MDERIILLLTDVLAELRGLRDELRALASVLGVADEEEDAEMLHVGRIEEE